MCHFNMSWWEKSVAKNIWDDLTLFGKLFYPFIILIVYTIIPILLTVLFIWVFMEKFVKYLEKKLDYKFENIIFKKKTYDNEE